MRTFVSHSRTIWTASDDCDSDVRSSQSSRCIIVDSIAALPRSEYSNDSIIERQEMLGKQAVALKSVAEAFSIPVVVTNQVTTRITAHDEGDGEGSHLTAALGTKWSHCVNTRIMLHQPREDGHKFLEVVKSPCIPCVKVPFLIDISGPRSVSVPHGAASGPEASRNAAQQTSLVIPSHFNGA